MPFESTRVVHADWSEHHAPVAAGFQTSTVTIGNYIGTGYDPETDDTGASHSDLYTGPAAIQAVNAPQTVQQAGQTIAGHTYLVELDYDAQGDQETPLAPGARLLVVESPNDPLLAGQSLWVIDVQMGSERFSRVLMCSDNQSDIPSTA